MFRRRKRDEDLDRELQSHLELEAEEQKAGGISDEQARYAAQRAFGNLISTKEEIRRMSRFARLEVFLQDLRYAGRSLRKSLGFATTAILTIAFGIGASTAVFTVVDSVVLKPLSYRNSGQLLVAWERVRFLSSGPTGPNPKHVDIWQRRNNVFRGLAVFRNMPMGVTLGTEHPRLTGVVPTTANLFDVLEAVPLLGRTFLPEDEMAGHDKVAILTYKLWQSLFQGDPNVIGKTIRLDDLPRQVIGVMPATFHFPNSNALSPTRSVQAFSSPPEPSLFFPVAFDYSQMEWNGNYGNWICLGRLKPGVTTAQAEAQLTAIQAQIIQEIPAGRGDHSPGALLAQVQPMQEVMVGESKRGLTLLMAAVVGLLLIACLNLANAQLGRAASRSREAAVRLALGAPKRRLLWSSLAENLLLAAVGGTAGVLLAYFGLELFRRYSPVDIPRMAEIHLNLIVLGVSVALTIAASIASGILPALRTLSIDPQSDLQQGGARTLGRQKGHQTRRWLIGMQVFGSTVLLLITGLFSRSLLNILQQDKGFETGHIAIAEVRLNPHTYGTDQSRASFIDVVLQNMRALPGVQSAAMVSGMPLEGSSWIEQLQRLDRLNQKTPLINFRWVSPGYFETTGQRLVAGRFIEERDRNIHGAVLSEGEAKAVWGAENPIGAQVRIEGRTFNVVGIVADSRNTSLKSPPAKMAYVHFQDRPPYSTYFTARTALPASTLISGMRQAIWSYAPGVNIARVKTLDSQLNDSLATERFQTFVLLSFGAAALLLSMLGIYGVLNYSVATRIQEIGLRMALGATRSGVYAQTFSEAAVPVLAGLAAGLVASVAMMRVVKGLLYGVQGVDLPVSAIVLLLFLVSAAIAAFLPARRAASVDPMEALRSE